MERPNPFIEPAREVLQQQFYNNQSRGIDVIPIPWGVKNLDGQKSPDHSLTIGGAYQNLLILEKRIRALAAKMSEWDLPPGSIDRDKLGTIMTRAKNLVSQPPPEEAVPGAIAALANQKTIDLERRDLMLPLVSQRAKGTDHAGIHTTKMIEAITYVVDEVTTARSNLEKNRDLIIRLQDLYNDLQPDQGDLGNNILVWIGIIQNRNNALVKNAMVAPDGHDKDVETVTDEIERIMHFNRGTSILMDVYNARVGYFKIDSKGNKVHTERGILQRRLSQLAYRYDRLSNVLTESVEPLIEPPNFDILGNISGEPVQFEAYVEHWGGFETVYMNGVIARIDGVPTPMYHRAWGDRYRIKAHKPPRFVINGDKLVIDETTNLPLLIPDPVLARKGSPHPVTVVNIQSNKRGDSHYWE